MRLLMFILLLASASIAEAAPFTFTFEVTDEQAAMIERKLTAESRGRLQGDLTPQVYLKNVVRSHLDAIQRQQRESAALCVAEGRKDCPK